MSFYIVIKISHTPHPPGSMVTLYLVSSKLETPLTLVSVRVFRRNGINGYVCMCVYAHTHACTCTWYMCAKRVPLRSWLAAVGAGKLEMCGAELQAVNAGGVSTSQP